MRLVIFCKSYVYLSFIEDNSKKPTIVLTWYFNRGESGLLKFRCFFSLQSFRLGTEGITYKFIGICYFSACVTRHQKWDCGTCPQIHNKTSCKSCHDGLSARIQIPCWITVQFRTAYTCFLPPILWNRNSVGQYWRCRICRHGFQNGGPKNKEWSCQFLNPVKNW